MRITGERVVTRSGGFNPTFQRHVAAYAMAAPFLGPGRVLDLGCGIGHSFKLLAPRETVGVDADPQALAGQERETHVGDMRAVPLGDSSFESVLCIQAIEHVREGSEVVAEVARLLEPGGTAVFITPNRLTFARPDEIIDPYHHVEYDCAALRDLCAVRFGEVEMHGIFGSARYLELVGEEKARLDALLAKDPLRLRRLVPRAVKQRLYDRRLSAERRDADPRAEAIGVSDFDLRDSGLEACLDLVAVCRAGRAP